MKTWFGLVWVALLIGPSTAWAQTAPIDTPPPPPASVPVAEPVVPPPPPAAPPSPQPSTVAPPQPQPSTAAAWSSQVQTTEPEVDHAVSLTISPLHLILPIVELTLEVRAAEQLGIALIGGVGTLTARLSDDSERSLTAIELGTSLRYYVVGDFNGGMQLGVELLWVKVFLDDATDADVSSSADGVAVGPMIGYKYTSSIGFTFDGQLGVQWITARAEASSDTDSASSERTTFIPLLNVNVGWSF